MKYQPEALIMCFNDPSSDPRPRRTIELLKSNGFTVDCIGSPMSEHLLLDRIIEIPESDKMIISRIFRRFRLYFIQFLLKVIWGNYLRDLLNDIRYNVFSFRNKIIVDSYNVIIVEDLQLLPLAFRIKNSASVIFDAREYYPRQNEDSRVFRFLEKPERVRLCREYLRRCEKIITVSPGLANEYKKEFGVTSDIVYSFPVYHDVEAVTTNPDRIRMVHHGIANRNRKLENMIDVVNKLDNNFSIDFYLNGNQKYIDELILYGSGNSNISFNAPVLFTSIIPMLNDYDIGFYYLEPHGFNVKFSLPNKLFEFIQARLAIAIGPSPNMAEIVRNYKCGIVSDTFTIEGMVEKLSSISVSDIDRFKNNSHYAASELCWENEGSKILSIIESW